MNQSVFRRVYRVTVLIALAAVVFWLFFQINKARPFRDINPFAEDPYDAVGSFAVQAALLVAFLTYARSLRLREDSGQASKTRLILRGNALVLFAIGITLVTDVIAEVFSREPITLWGSVLLAELAVMIILASICIAALVMVFRSVPAVAPPLNLTPADGIDDLLTLVRVPVTKVSVFLPGQLVNWVTGISSDRLFGRLPWINPRSHPWRFAWALGLLAGLAIVAAQLMEGSPPSLRIGLLLMTIFLSVETTATLIGFALLGGYLGVRPAWRR